eukprot:CAMPEP_0168756082 /NCGR_PEP_ID=MMETSP0724-20121128/20411_1 /TAXON_ID=265536 /ORGANISM="Amphiprora sp., Strain CCMP467" /LENGTH=493 /DNA_ID=CAMNT_0008804737 /DNA_START=89 /DNA_END=1571 /DNA_ORIENTATION=+
MTKDTKQDKNRKKSAPPSFYPSQDPSSNPSQTPSAPQTQPATFFKQTVSTNPDDPLILTLVEETTTVSYFDTPGSTPSIFDFAIVEEAAGQITSVKYDEETGEIVQLINYADDFQLDVVFKTDTVAVATFSYQGNVYSTSVDFLALDTRRHLDQKEKAPKIQKKDKKKAPKAKTADVEQSRRDLQAQSSYRRVDIKLTQCGQPYTEPNLKLNYKLFSEAGTESSSTWCTPTVDDYHCWIDLGVQGTLDEILEFTKEACKPVVKAIDLVCDDIIGGGKLSNKFVRRAFCALLGAAADVVVGGPTGEGAAIAAVCIIGLERASKACSVIDPSLPGNGDDTDIAKEICNAIEVDDPIDAIQWSLDPELYCFCPAVLDEIPELDIGVIPSAQVYDYGTFEVGNNEPVVESVSTSPFDPNPSQSYVFSATVSCVVDDGSVVLSVVGTDGYTDSAFCSPPSGDPYTCTLSVPGAEAGVFDKLTVSIAPDGVSKTLNIIF